MLVTFMEERFSYLEDLGGIPSIPAIPRRYIRYLRVYYRAVVTNVVPAEAR